MNTTFPSTVTSRPTYTRQISSDSRVEMQALPNNGAQPSPSASRPSSYAFSSDTFDPGPTSIPVPGGAQREAPTLAARLRPRLPQVSSGFGRAVVYAGDTLRTHWRDLTVGGVLTGVVSWAIWATVKINRVSPEIPYCVFQDPGEL